METVKHVNKFRPQLEKLAFYVGFSLLVILSR